MSTRKDNKTAFDIKESKEGDVADGRDFVLLPHENDLLLKTFI